ncbi:MAG TPA: alpha/beta hydrolase-fold protein [Actinomycetota bacterium]|nr:alpha/beta hydrolase-fold protein [Actinomycetota bacterium]
MQLQPWGRTFTGRLDRLEIDSEALRGNALGDPSVRPIWVYTPPGYDDEPERRYPTVYVIQGLTGQLDMWGNREPFRQNFPEAVDELFASGQAPPTIVAFVDCWTSIGGSQFLNSPGTGRYQDFLCDEAVAFVDERYRTIADREHRAIQGKSSGGYGALVVPMMRPDVFSALASHAGDALFEACYLPEFAKSVRALRIHYDGSFDRFWEDFRSRPAFTKPDDDVLLNDWCMAACYSADEDGTVRLPFDPATGILIDEVWRRWLEVDPVRMVPTHADEMRSMRAIWIDAGTKDEWFLDNGAVAVSKQLEAIGVEHTLELFDAGHMSIGYRYPRSLAFLADALARPA